MSSDPSVRDQLAQNIRLYADLRFKQLTLFMAVQTLAGAGVAQFGSRVVAGSIAVNTALACFAMLATFVTSVMEVRAVLYWTANVGAAPEIMPTPSKTVFSWLNATNAVLVLYVVIYGFWLYCAFLWHLYTVVWLLFLLLGLLLVTFVLVVYRGLWASR
jgi:hypothetical protein